MVHKKLPRRRMIFLLLAASFVMGSGAVGLLIAGRHQDSPSAAISPAAPVAGGDAFDTHSISLTQLRAEPGVCGAEREFQLSSDPVKVSAQVGPILAQVSDPIVYGDLNGDRVDELALKLVCSFDGGNGVVDQGYLVFEYADASVRQVQFITAQGATDGGLRGGVTSLKFEPRRIVAIEMHYRDSDARCCPSITTTVEWDYSDGGLTPQAT